MDMRMDSEDAETRDINGHRTEVAEDEDEDGTNTDLNGHTESALYPEGVGKAETEELSFDD